METELISAGSHLQNGDVESVYEILYGDKEDWALAVLPNNGQIAASVAPAAQSLLAELEKAVATLSGNQYLVAVIHGQQAEIRTLPTQKILVDRSFVVVGRGPMLIEARVVASGNGAPKLVSFAPVARP